jgi:glutamate-1-semialdehyde 2,1-aminomutase
MYQAGTLAGNPLAMMAGLTTLRKLLAPGVFATLAARTASLAAGIERTAAAAGVPTQVSHVGSMFGCYILRESGAAISDYASARRLADTERYATGFHALLERGVYLAPSQFEAGFVSTAHTEEDIGATVAAFESVFGGLVQQPQ